MRNIFFFTKSNPTTWVVIAFAKHLCNMNGREGVDYENKEGR